MWIRNTDPEAHPTVEMSDPEGTLGETVEFTDNWKANVAEDVGEQMTEYYDHIVATNGETEDDEE